MSLHPLLGGKSHQSGGKHDARRRPVATEELAERGISKSYHQQHKNRIYGRLRDKPVITLLYLIECQPLVDSLPAQRAQIRVTLETYRQSRYADNSCDVFSAVIVVGGHHYAFLKSRHLYVDSLRLSYTLGIAYDARSMHARP